jgi:hypothetical protein
VADATIAKLAAGGDAMFRSPIFAPAFHRLHYTFIDGEAVAYFAVYPYSGNDGDSGWRMSVLQRGPWRVELGMSHGSAARFRRFTAAFQEASQTCLAEATSGSPGENPSK